MNRLGNELFACARLADDQHGAIGACNLFDLLVYRAHRRRLADQQAEMYTLRLRIPFCRRSGNPHVAQR
jgi:hypothetical protein